ncbi:MAG: response regulator [Abitibacteriaceae bacterium]|nr:response regulator [Abditibacteriaceae bacterium]
MNRVLIIDDDVQLSELVAEYLKREGLAADAVHEGEGGVEQALTGCYAVIVLDVMLPGISGFEVLRRIRVRSRIPVLFLTARGEEVDRVMGLEFGADDYLAKPFSSRELVARIRAILRRVHSEGELATCQCLATMVWRKGSALSAGLSGTKRTSPHLKHTNTDTNPLSFQNRYATPGSKMHLNPIGLSPSHR